MEDFFIGSGLALLAFVAVSMYRVVAGPSVMDRLVAANAVGTKTTVLLVFIGVIYQRLDMFVDFALTYALLNFLASIAAAEFFERHRAVDLSPRARRQPHDT